MSAQYLIYEDVPLNLVSVASHETYHVLQDLLSERGPEAFDVVGQNITQKLIDCWEADLDMLESAAYRYDDFASAAWARKLEELGYVINWGDVQEPQSDIDPHYERYL